MTTGRINQVTILQAGWQAGPKGPHQAHRDTVPRGGQKLVEH